MTLILGLLQRWLSADAPRVGPTEAIARPLRAAAVAHPALAGAACVSGVSAVQSGVHCAAARSGRALSHTAARPLRVVRLVDRRHGASRHDGRLLISGGIDAVCAELDRLAALEERRH